MKRNLADWKRKMQDQTYLLQRTLKATATGNITKKKIKHICTMNPPHDKGYHKAGTNSLPQ